MVMDRPQLIAHRGYAYRYPENTLPALSAAIDTGARHVEFDVQLTANRVPVVLHDANLKRTTGVDSLVHERVDHEVLKLSAHEPQRLGGRFAGVAIPTLIEASDLITNAPGVTGFVEIKEESIAAFGRDEVVTIVMNVLNQSRTPDCFVLISYDLEAIMVARNAGWSGVGWILRHWDEASRLAAQEACPQYLFTNTRRVPDTHEPFWHGPWRWAVYEIAEADAALAWGKRGADLVETFRIGDLLADARWANQGENNAGV